MDRVWWNHIAKAHKFLMDVVTTALEGKSIILSVPENLPWYHTFVDMIQEQLNLENSRNSFDIFRCPDEEIGLYFLEHYCRREKRATYRPGMTYAAFLGRSEDIVLNDRYIWVTDIPESRYQEWVDFILDYNKNITSKPPAIFILETHDDSFAHKAKKGIRKILFSQNIISYDKFAFCALVTAETNCKDCMRMYLAELVSILCDDIELCAECVREGKRFLKNPAEIIREILTLKYRSNGEKYRFSYSDKEIKQFTWEAQLKHVFPLIEKYRNYFTNRYMDAIRNALPINNSNGEIVSSPQDVEIGTLLYMVGRGDVIIGSKEYENLQMYRDARNKLAHVNVLASETVEKILRMQS